MENWVKSLSQVQGMLNDIIIVNIKANRSLYIYTDVKT